MKLKLKVGLGSYKGSVLIYPKNVKISPTKGKVKEALFNILKEEIKGKVFFDLFSGTGSIGIEALSVGAKYVSFVEKDRNCIAAISENLNKLKIPNVSYRIFCKDIFSFLKETISICDYIYLDPPYDEYDYKNLFSNLKNLKIDSNIPPLFILEHSQTIKQFSGFDYLDCRSYGKTKLSFFELKGMIK